MNKKEQYFPLNSTNCMKWLQDMYTALYILIDD